MYAVLFLKFLVLRIFSHLTGKFGKNNIIINKVDVIHVQLADTTHLQDSTHFCLCQFKMT